MDDLLQGRWLVSRCDVLDRRALRLLGEPFVNVDRDGGEFTVAALRGGWSGGDEDVGSPRLEFDWLGDDDGHEVSGRGMIRLREDGSLRLVLRYAGGDRYRFNAERSR